MTTCTVKEKCCFRYYNCYNRQRVVKSCAPFYCENGGTRIPQIGKRDVAPPGAGCEIPTPVCRCPPGFSGRCCQIRDPIDPCKNKTCGYEEVCKLQNVQCVTTPCHQVAVCVSLNPCKHTKCGPGQECKLQTVQCVTTPCPPIAVCVPVNPCKHTKCGPGEECTVQAVICKKKPCPPKAVCVPVDLCKDKLCPKGEVCQLVPIVCVTTPCPPNFEAVCIPAEVRPGFCPPNDIIGICQVTKDGCLSDTQCDINEKCCSRGCGRQCVPVLTNPCAAILCLQDQICVVQDNGEGKCVPQPVFTTPPTS
ncbi:neurogenic locus notch homolog protein 4-like [Corticium candelabrum]|uniref:neurogenic locus notch homolog protein 4-like n=1 Tax=Corticium candelabrum TaxID=121492 RepID=UPI002E2640AB|nr:neurogenic locus notch homolog protein 4-like [Corticium candelabrum]